MDRMITCINCPIGCRMIAKLDKDGIFLTVAGNSCPRGAVYAQQECTSPVRMITAVLHVSDSSIPLSVKTSCPVPKKKIKDIMNVLASVQISSPVHIGQIIIQNVLGTGSDIIATRNIEKT